MLDQPDDGWLDRALSYWVPPTDRRLPLAFLDRTLRDLLAPPFDELIATQGVGQKKIMGFFELLQRAQKPTATEKVFGFDRRPRTTAPTKAAFDPTPVVVLSDTVVERAIRMQPLNA